MLSHKRGRNDVMAKVMPQKTEATLSMIKRLEMKYWFLIKSMMSDFLTFALDVTSSSL